MTKTIITHVSPDWDAIASVWLLKRYGGLENADVMFVNTGAPDADLLTSATAVVDTGRIFDPTRLRFDHHQLPGKEANETCAAWQVFQHIAPNGELVHLAPLNALILNGDTGGRNYGAEWSRLTGIHALLSVRKARRESNEDLLSWGFGILDDLDAHLHARYEAKEALALHTVYRSDDGLVVALRDAPQGATFAAHEAGARLVVFANYEKNAIGVLRGGEGQDVHVGGLVSGLCNDYDCGLDEISAPLFDELCTWYRHQAGFFAGRGTDKAPSETPITVDLVDVARAIDTAWTR